MTLITQTLVMSRLSLSSLPQRAWPSLVIVISVASVIGVLLSMLSATVGLVRAYRTGAGPAMAIVMSAEADSEYGNSISRNDVATIMSAPGIARRPEGDLAGDAEILFWIPPAEGYKIASPELRGIGRAGVSLRPKFTIVSGRLFQPGRQELIVGVGAQRAFGLKVGDKLILPRGDWPIVGTFSADGAILEGQLLADADTVIAGTGISGFGSVLVRLQNDEAFDAFKRWLATNPTLAVTAERQSAYYSRTANRYSAFFTEIAYIIAAIMSIGALFGSVKIMYAAVSYRTHEIATLRAIGYGPVPAAIAVMIEMVVLSLAGACVGTGIAWLLFNGKAMANNQNVFNLAVSPQLFMLGTGWAVALAILGSFPPAVRAGRLSVVEGLRGV